VANQRNQALELGVEIIQTLLCAIDMLIAQYRATYCHPVCVSLFLVHAVPLSDVENQEAAA
jgi:hypothetical protein